MKKIRRRCKCGCGEITNYGKMYVRGHNWRNKKHSAESKEKMSLAHQNMSAETKEKMSEALKGRKQTAEAILNRSLAKMKYDPDNPYCDVWKSREYKNDIRRDYCENKDCKEDYKRLCNHHIHLDKKKCKPIDIITLCNPCHAILHAKLQRGTKIPADPKDFIIINRPDHVSYIHKESRTVIKIRKEYYENWEGA